MFKRVILTLVLVLSLVVQAEAAEEQGKKLDLGLTYYCLVSGSADKDKFPVVGAKALFALYKRNELRARAAYKGKRLAVYGTITDISTDLMTEAPVVSIKGNNGIGVIDCTFPLHYNMDEFMTLEKGAEICVIGTLDRFLFLTLNMQDCEFGYYVYDLNGNPAK